MVERVAGPRSSHRGVAVLALGLMAVGDEEPRADGPSRPRSPGLHWSFVPPVRPELPVGRSPERDRDPLDAFVRVRLEDAGLEPAAEAEPQVLLRRVSLDLTGLPPSPDEVAAFLADREPGAFARQVDRLLDSPRYGEHMAWGWLETARYADTDGYQNDRLRDQWVWRDWVIHALNRNLPFDRFTVQQIAGDLLPDRSLDTQIATGFQRNHRINSEAGSLPDEFLVEYVVDRVDTTSTAWMGLTVGCARCHDHEYDPISQKEYYGLFAFFHSVDEYGIGPNDGNSPPFVPVPAGWPAVDETARAFVTPEPVTLNEDKSWKFFRPKRGGPDTVMVLHERAEARPTYLLRRGLYDRPDRSEEILPAVPAVLGRIRSEGRKSRLDLARWLTAREHPLTARVAVNRAWQHFFGRGLVASSDNLGVRGEAPSHPLLLDALAVEFMESGWDVKALHRRLVLSATYRRATRVSTEQLGRDPGNVLLARASRRRLSAASLRDSALAASGLLVERVGGAPVRPYQAPGLWNAICNTKYVQDHGDALYRRSLYTYWRRTVPPALLATFGAPDRDRCVVLNDAASSPLQALSLMNHVAFLEAARHLGERMLAHAAAPPERLAFGVLCALGRHPSVAEADRLALALEVFHDEFRREPKRARQLLDHGEIPRDETLDLVEAAAYAMVAHTLFNLDEFLTR